MRIDVHTSILIMIAGKIPDFSNNVKLETLILYNNKLTGMPGLMSTHQSLLFHAGPVPDFSNCTALKELYLDQNELTGGCGLMSTHQS